MLKHCLLCLSSWYVWTVLPFLTVHKYVLQSNLFELVEGLQGGSLNGSHHRMLTLLIMLVLEYLSNQHQTDIRNIQKNKVNHKFYRLFIFQISQIIESNVELWKSSWIHNTIQKILFKIVQITIVQFLDNHQREVLLSDYLPSTSQLDV